MYFDVVDRLYYLRFTIGAPLYTRRSFILNERVRAGMASSGGIELVSLLATMTIDVYYMQMLV